MQICGIVSEYNPFHSGHEWHIARTRKITGAELIVCAMSGSFVQRGEPAVFDKWTRAACALQCGADAVLELPLLSAIQSAEGFASGGVRVLAAAGATSLSFGCETDDLALLQKLALTLGSEDSAYKDTLKSELRAGKSFPRARMNAAFPGSPESKAFWDATAPDIASMPGALLGIEYMKAIHKYHPHIAPHVVRREGAGYHSDDIGEYLPSATAIRAAFSSGETEKALAAMPGGCRDYIRTQLGAGLLPAFAERFGNALLTALRLKGPEYIAQLPDVSEGLENRIYTAALQCAARAELISRIKTKRYTYARISRILLCALLGVTRDAVQRHNDTPIDHIRVLGVKSPDVLSALSKAASAPIVTAAAPPYPKIDIAASNVWALTQAAPPFRNTDRDYTERLLIGSQI
jgi:Predicted nucleotidyltransferase